MLTCLSFHPQFHAIVMHLYHKLFPDFHGAFLRLHPFVSVCCCAVILPHQCVSLHASDGTVFVRLSTAISAVKQVLVNKPAARILNVLQLSPSRKAGCMYLPSVHCSLTHSLLGTSARRARFLQKVHMMATTAEEAGLGENGKILTNSNSESFQDIVKMLGHDPESHTQ